MEQPHSDWPVLHFAQSNPSGDGQENIPALLRRVADSLEQLGPIEVLDMCFHALLSSGTEDPTLVVYYVKRD